MVWHLVKHRTTLPLPFIFCIVKHAPNILTYLMEDPLPARLFKHFGSERLVLEFLVGVLLLTIAVVAAGTHVYIR
jgi:hypothetical protein